MPDILLLNHFSSDGQMELPTIEMGENNEVVCDTIEQRQHSVTTFEVRGGGK